MRCFLLAHTVKNLPVIQETWVLSLGWEDPLEKGMATHSNILAWRIPWTEEPGELESMGLQNIREDWMMNVMTYDVAHLSMCLISFSDEASVKIFGPLKNWIVFSYCWIFSVLSIFWITILYQVNLLQTFFFPTLWLVFSFSFFSFSFIGQNL